MYFQHFVFFILFAFLACHCKSIRMALRHAWGPISGAGWMAFWIYGCTQSHHFSGSLNDGLALLLANGHIIAIRRGNH